MDFCVSNGVATPDSCLVRVQSDAEPFQIAGPFAAMSRTLPNYSPFKCVDSGIYSADVSDPAIWSPEHPVFYRIEFRDGSKRVVGIRKTEVCNASLFIDGRRTVLRATYSPISPAFVDLKLSAICKCGEAETERMLVEATDLGIPVILDATDCRDDLTAHSSWPCVVAVVLPIRENEPDSQISANALRIVRITNSDQTIPSWAHGAVVRHDVLSSCRRPLPTAPFLFAESNDVNSSVAKRDVASIRRACERLQCSLAPEFSLAGYIA